MMRWTIRTIKKPNIWLSLILIAAFTIPFGNRASAAQKSETFVIHADQISGNMLPPTLVIENGRPYLRFQYATATIQGLTLTKELQTPSGPMTVKVKAPSATAKNLKVDVAAFSFGGACLKLGKAYPQLALKNMTLAVHKQTAGELSLQNAKISSVPGNHRLAKPSVPGLLANLANTTSGSLQNAIQQLMNGHVPLLQCGGTTDKNGGSQNNGNPASQVKKTVNKTTNAVKGTVNHTEKTVKEVTGDAGKTVKEVTGDAGKTVKSVIKGAGNTAKKLGGDVKKTVGDVTSGNPGKLPGDVQKTVCDGIKQIQKQLNGVADKGKQIKDQAEKILSESRTQHKKLQDLISQLTGNQKQIQDILAKSLNATHLKSLKDQLKVLKGQEQSVNDMKKKINEADYGGQLDNLQNQLDHLQSQLSHLNGQTACASGSFDQVKKTLQQAANEVKQGKTQSSQLSGQLSSANQIVKKTVQKVEDFVHTHDKGGGLLGGLGGVLTGLFGGITNLLGDIKNLLS